MNAKEVTKWECSECGRIYRDETTADKCCVPVKCSVCGETYIGPGNPVECGHDACENCQVHSEDYSFCKNCGDAMEEEYARNLEEEKN